MFTWDWDCQTYWNSHISRIEGMTQEGFWPAKNTFNFKPRTTSFPHAGLGSLSCWVWHGTKLGLTWNKLEFQTEGACTNVTILERDVQIPLPDLFAAVSKGWLLSLFVCVLMVKQFCFRKLPFTADLSQWPEILFQSVFSVRWFLRIVEAENHEISAMDGEIGVGQKLWAWSFRIWRRLFESWMSEELLDNEL
jgi:hypothetical protein